MPASFRREQEKNRDTSLPLLTLARLLAHQAAAELTATAQASNASSSPHITVEEYDDAKNHS